MTNITGQLTQATQEREALRLAMRTAKAAKDKAQYKREFRKARNKVEFIKKNQLEEKLKEGYLAKAKLDLKICEDFKHVDKEGI